MSSAYSCRRSGPIINDPSFVSISENPMMALSGVRSSWLMVARKRLLATLARSASARASSSTCSWTLRSVMSRMTATTSRSLPLAACSQRPAAHLDPDELPGRRNRRVGRIAADPELHRPAFALRGGIGERREVGRAVGNVHAVEQAVAQEVLHLGAEERLGRRRHEQDGAVAPVARDDIGHVAREQTVAVLLGVKQPEAGARKQFRAERETGGVERSGDDAERRERGLLAPPLGRRRDEIERPHEQQQTGGAEREGRGNGDDAAGSRQRRLERHHDQPDRGERPDAAGADRNHGDEPGERERGEHVGALILPGAREEIGDENRRDQPGEDQNFEQARHAAHGQVDRKCGERDQAAEQPRRDEGPMARGRQRVLLRRRMHQGVDIVSDRSEQTHVPVHARRFGTRSPYWLAGSCQRALKRTLRRQRGGGARPHLRFILAGFRRRIRAEW